MRHSLAPAGHAPIRIQLFYEQQLIAKIQVHRASAELQGFPAMLPAKGRVSLAIADDETVFVVGFGGVKHPEHVSVVVFSGGNFRRRDAGMLELDDRAMELHVGAAIADTHFYAVSRELRFPPQMPSRFGFAQDAGGSGEVRPVPSDDGAAFRAHGFSALRTLPGKARPGRDLGTVFVFDSVEHKKTRKERNAVHKGDGLASPS